MMLISLILASCKPNYDSHIDKTPQFSRVKTVYESYVNFRGEKNIRTENIYNKDGKLTRSNTYENDSLRYYKLYYYNSEKQIQDVVTYSKNASNQKLYVVEEMILYEYSKSKYLTEKIVSSIDKNQSRTVLFFYNETHKLVKQQVLKKNIITRESTYEYNELGKLKTKHIHYMSPKHTSRMEYDYSSNILTSITTYDEKGKVISCRNFYYNTINEKVLEEKYIYPPKHEAIVKKHYNYEVTNNRITDSLTQRDI
ncbi:hypothetical protein K5X82_13340 [Halosquirtibacter xylanolyticus]|uniref:hypothetical protein n=1 Tax=Halosquirtibacter xylanolyticus TaxID=3374599 RepID=UPI0037498E89|nr:hypothetical protein K5X82_13340 [Prolixibacteraceae bacterium]